MTPDTSTSFVGTDAEILATYPVMRQLRPHQEEATYVANVREAERLGLRLAAHTADGRVVAVAGFRLLYQLKSGLVLYVDDLVTDEGERSKRYGDALLDWLVAHAREQQCVAFELDSGVHRFAAHRFYFRKRMRISAYHFQMEL